MLRMYVDINEGYVRYNITNHYDLSFVEAYIFPISI